jgi:hypothetical protein
MNNSSWLDSLMSGGLVTIIILFIIYLIFREFNCWYWKINEHISLQKEQNLILNKILKAINNDIKSNEISKSEYLTKTNDEVKEDQQKRFTLDRKYDNDTFVIAGIIMTVIIVMALLAFANK